MADYSGNDDPRRFGGSSGPVTSKSILNGGNAEVQRPEVLLGVTTPETVEDFEETVRGNVLLEARELITGDRNVSYGTPTQNFANIAALWNVRFGHMLAEGQKFTGHDVADAMILLKVARNVAQPKRDNYVDLSGYAACGWESLEEEQREN